MRIGRKFFDKAQEIIQQYEEIKRAVESEQTFTKDEFRALNGWRDIVPEYAIISALLINSC